MYFTINSACYLWTLTLFVDFRQTAAMKRWKRLMMETDEFVSSGEGFLMDPLSMSTAYQKMRTLCMNVRSEVRADIEIHNKHVLPRSELNESSLLVPVDFMKLDSGRNFVDTSLVWYCRV